MMQEADVPDDWVAYARGVARDRTEPTYHRALAASVVGLGQRTSDITWLREAIRHEYDPAIIRAYMVALARVSALDRDLVTTVEGRTPGLRRSVAHLRGRRSLPSSIYTPMP